MAEHTPLNIPFEDMFAPCTHLRDWYATRYPERNFEEEVLQNYNRVVLVFLVVEEVALTAAGPEILRNGTLQEWVKFFEYVQGKIVWMDDEVFIDGVGLRPFYRSDTAFAPVMQVITMNTYSRLHIWAHTATHATVTIAACDLVIRLVASCTDGSVCIASGELRDPDSATEVVEGPPLPALLVSPSTLSRLITEDMYSSKLTLFECELNAGQCGALRTNVRDGLQVTLRSCSLTVEGERVLLDGIRHNQGPKSLQLCNISTRRLTDALCGNSSVERLELCKESRSSSEGLVYFLQALPENLGLKWLYVTSTDTDDKSLSLLCRSVANHPSLEVFQFDVNEDESEERNTRISRALAGMLLVNTVLQWISTQTVDLDPLILRDEIYPRLEVNKYRPRIVTVRKAGQMLRKPLLGRALHAVSANNTLLYHFLKGSKDILSERHNLRPRKARKRSRYGK